MHEWDQILQQKMGCLQGLFFSDKNKKLWIDVLGINIQRFKGDKNHANTDSIKMQAKA